jgi:tetratricopeptide (TPR) repeat protein
VIAGGAGVAGRKACATEIAVVPAAVAQAFRPASRLRGLLTIALLAAAAACAPKTVAVPPTTAPKFPDFIFPAPPAGLGTPAALERHDLAWRWLQAGDTRAAERNFNAALKQTDGFYPAEAGLGYTGLARKDYKAAASHFDRAVVANPRYAPALAGRGEALLALGERELALKSFEAALGADPRLETLRSRVEVLRFRGLQDDLAEARKLADSGRLRDARAAYEAAIAASPQSPFLYRELAIVERRDGDVTSAITHAEKAVELDPNDSRALTLIGEIHESQKAYLKAVDAYEAALAIEQSDELANKIEDLRERAAFEAMPEEYRTIENSPTVTRGELAALLGVRLDDLLKRSRTRNAVVITDARGHWASPWILSSARAGLLEVYPNHTFQPQASVRRADLAQAASRALSLIAAHNPRMAASWRNARRQFPDVSPGHLSYPAASLAVESGVMTTLEDGTFQLTRPVTGAEAVAAVRALEDLAERARR